MMIAEHDAAGEAMARTRALSGGFTPPKGARPTYRGFFQALEEFEKDLQARNIRLRCARCLGERGVTSV